MRTATIAFTVSMLAGCAAVQDTISPATTAEESANRHQLRMEQEKQRQFERCMNLVKGKFGDFSSQEARLKAAETCKQENPKP